MRRIIVTSLAITALAVTVAVVIGCGTTSSGPSSKLSKDSYAQIEVGMTAGEVTALAGEPSRKEDKSAGGGHSMSSGEMAGEAMVMENWYYQGDNGWVRLELADGKVTGKEGY